MCATNPRVIERPAWGWLYGAVLPPLAGLAIVEATSPPNVLRTVLRSVLAMTVLIGMALWVRANRAAFDLQDWCECAASTVTVRVVESRRPEAARAPAPLDPLPTPPARDYEVVRR